MLWVSRRGGINADAGSLERRAIARLTRGPQSPESAAYQTAPRQSTAPRLESGTMEALHSGQLNNQTVFEN